MKKILIISLMCIMAFTGLYAQGSNEVAESSATEITLWTYPIGTWGGTTPTTEAMIASFEAAHPDIKVKVQYLDYTSGDDKVTSAIAGGTTPDLIMEGPERLVANWGAKGLLVPLNDLWTDSVTADIKAVSTSVVDACKGADGNFYEMPLAMTAHTMAINYDIFEAAGALKYIDEETRTWTTENFIKALKAIKDSGLVQIPGIIYSNGVGGDQGTRALFNNLYSGSFTNAAFTEYTANSPENKKAFAEFRNLIDAGLMIHDPSLAGGDEINQFVNLTSAMTFCWNAALAGQADKQPREGFTPYPMAFPSDDGVPELCGGMWGFGIFDNDDAAKVDAAKKFIQFMCDDAAQGKISVAATSFFPVRASQSDVYKGAANEAIIDEYSTFLTYLGPYYNVIGNWTEARTGWWNLMQQVYSGADIDEATQAFVDAVNP